MSKLAQNQIESLREAIWRGDGASDTLDLVVGAPLIISAMSFLGALIFLFAPDRLEPTLFAVIAGILVISVALKIFVDRRRKSTFLQRAADKGVPAHLAKQFYDKFDWEEGDAKQD